MSAMLQMFFFEVIMMLGITSLGWLKPIIEREDDKSGCIKYITCLNGKQKLWSL